jgi:hypothetical protein
MKVEFAERMDMKIISDHVAYLWAIFEDPEYAKLKLIELTREYAYEFGDQDDSAPDFYEAALHYGATESEAEKIAMHLTWRAMKARGAI